MIRSITKPVLGAQANNTLAANIGLVGAWLFNEGGGLLAFDSSGRGQQGVLAGSAMAQPGYFGYGLFCNGTNAVANINATVANFATGPFFCSAWAKSTTDADGAFICGNSNFQSTGFSMGMAQPSATFIPRVIINTTAHDGTFDVSGGAWHHWCFVRDAAGVCNLYIDGVSQLSFTDAGTVTTAIVFSIGQCGNASYFWNGNVDHVILGNQSLTVEQVLKFKDDPDWWMMPARRNVSVNAPVVAAGYLPLDLAHQPQHQTVLAM